MMKFKVLFILVLITSFSNCKKDTQKSSEIIIEVEDIGLLDTLTLKLNNGEKWVANNETQIGMLKMDSIIKAFKSDKTNIYMDLGRNLSKQTSFIIKSCNMTGEAHDQLHVVLVPMLDKISVLKESNSQQENKRVLINLEELIDEYFNHFEL